MSTTTETQPTARAEADSSPRCAVSSGSAQWVVIVGYPRDSLAGRFLEGPRTPKQVKRDGYGFAKEVSKAWPFASQRQANAKARIVERHMGWGEGVLVVEQKCANDTDGDGDCHLCARRGGCPLQNRQISQSAEHKEH